MKQANGYIRVEKEVKPKVHSNPTTLLLYSSALKPGSRFVDEQSTLVYNLATSEIRLTGKDGLAFFDQKEENKAEKSNGGVKASFKIEINDEERKVRDQ